MNKKLLHLAISISVLLPFSAYAEESIQTNLTPKGIITTVITVNNRDVITVKEKADWKIEGKEMSKDKEIAKETTDDATTTASSTSPVKNFTLCSQQAIETRDTKIASSRSIYNIAMTTALTDRKNKEKAAVAVKVDDDRKAAIKVSVDTYKSLTRAAQNALTSSRKTVWQDFETDIKKCHEIQDEAGAIEKDTADSKDTQKVQIDVSIKKADEGDGKTIKDSILSTLRSLFN